MLNYSVIEIDYRHVSMETHYPVFVQTYLEAVQGKY